MRQEISGSGNLQQAQLLPMVSYQGLQFLAKTKIVNRLSFILAAI
jgi:hypothetical protein